MPTIVVCTVSRGHKTSKSQCLHSLCVDMGPSMPKTHIKMRRCYADLIVCAASTFSTKFAKSLPAIVICTVSRGHKTSKSQWLNRLCVEMVPPMPKNILKCDPNAPQKLTLCPPTLQPSLAREKKAKKAPDRTLGR